MQFQGLGKVSDYIKTMTLNKKFQDRKDNPLLAKGTENEDPMIQRLREQAEQARESSKVESIKGKLKSGVRLSGDELEYLRENNPDMYRDAVEIEKERDEYRRELQQCKTKDDVRKLNQRKLTQLGAEAKSISSNPNIPQDKKLEALEKLEMRIANIQSEHTEFTDTPEYKALPEDDRKRDGGETQPVQDTSGGLYGIKDKLLDVKLSDALGEFERVLGSPQPAEPAGNTEPDTAAGSPEQTGKPDGTGKVDQPPRTQGRPATPHTGRVYSASGNVSGKHNGTEHTISVKV